jgi:hypothetical protein
MEDHMSLSFADNLKEGKMRIFQIAFFRLSAHDQAAIVDSVIRDLESAQFADNRGRQKAARMTRRICKKAIEHGVHAGEEDGTK